MKENKSNENILNTNQYFYRRKSNLLENYRTANLVKHYENINTYKEQITKMAVETLHISKEYMPGWEKILADASLGEKESCNYLLTLGTVPSASPKKKSLLIYFI